MPSTSPGTPTPTPTPFAQILPGAPTPSLQAVSTWTFRYKRYIAYISGKQLYILSSPTKLVQALTFAEELVAVTGESVTGKIAVASAGHAYVLEPVAEGWTRVWWEKALLLRREGEDPGDERRCLSWGSEGEILVGGRTHLTLFSIVPSSRTSSPLVNTIDGEPVEERKALWSKLVASPLRLATFSPTAGLIATCTGRDRLVKIWRRLSFEDGLFDFTYLPHGGIVTHMEWRPLDEHFEERRGSGISGRHEEDPEVLYTIATDGMLRIWRTGGIHDLDMLVLHTTIDLVGAIPQSPSLTAKRKEQSRVPPRYCFMLPAGLFGAGVTAATGRQKNDQVSHSLEHLKEVTSKTPDVVVALDGQGRMSAWGLQSIGHKRRIEAPEVRDAFHVAHSEGLNVRFAENSNATFCAWFEDDTINILTHTFGGGLVWWQGDVETFFSPSAAGRERLKKTADWVGHSSSIKTLRSVNNGTELISRSQSGDMARWAPGLDGQFQWHQEHAESAFSSEEKSDLGLELDEEFEGSNVETVNGGIAALASSDGIKLMIVAVKEGYVEHKDSFDHKIYHLRLLSPAAGHRLLAVGFDDRVDILAQGRYRNDGDLPTWATVKRVSIVGLGLRMNDIAWLRGGTLALAAGNGVLLSDNKASVEGLDEDLQQIVDMDPTQQQEVTLPYIAEQLKQPLPVWHPDVLIHFVHHGKVAVAMSLVRKLLNKLKFWSEGEYFSPLLDLDARELFEDNGEQDGSSLTDKMLRELTDQLEEKKLPAVSRSEQRRLIHVLQALVYISEHMHGLDQCALCYLFAWKSQLLGIAASDLPDSEQQKPNGVTHAVSPRVPRMQWREIAFAYHSTTQQPLLDILILHYDNKVTWDIARSLGITAWLADKEALAKVFEALAQATYRQTSPPDPINASLYFLALHKKPTLLGLWRIATWHKEQRSTTNFLKRDFSQPDAKTAAKKNAYALMGRRRFEYAAAFFLLADDPDSATNILAGQCGDVMLAIAVARLYSGDKSPTLRRLLEGRLMGQEADRWLLSWSHATLEERHEAAQALIRPNDDRRPRPWLQDDPTTLILYRDLRKSSSENEYAALLRSASILRRMGLWLLALDLVRSWSFLNPTAALSNGITNSPSLNEPVASPQPSEPVSALDGYTAPAAPATDDKAAREAKAAELLRNLKLKKQGQQLAGAEEKKPPPPPTQFKEPDAGSLLDSFGF
ncbi:hypothetical protein B0A50_00191 [Salinomyces thailandicus]|uniref:RAVE complex protein Rav1 C-terminal domain-containing protein n=1 Tax=Salinomyces thailandicus TaxID=706561 RepID=A0A4U0UF81_9PEZI|nr:hypothetical protein B0A50_00191 [Salinomyces thailandica]